ncbi:unnamed protein product [Boreogadus saida]
MEGQVAALHPGLEAANLEGLETAEVLEATAGLEVETNLEVLESVVGSNLEDLEAVERIVLPEASTERVWSWELQVDGGQEPFSPTGTDGGDGGGRLEVRGGRLEVLAVRSMAVVWRRSLQMEGRPGAVQPNGCRTPLGPAPGCRLEGLRQRPAWRRRWPGGGGGLEVLEASNLEGAAWRARWRLLIQRAWRRPTWKAWRLPRSWRPGGGGVLEGPEAAGSWRARRRRLLIQRNEATLRRSRRSARWRSWRRRPGGGGRLGDPAVEVRRRLVIRPTSSSSMEGLKESLGMKITAQGLTTPPPPHTHLSGEASSWCRRSNLHLFEETKQLND